MINYSLTNLINEIINKHNPEGENYKDKINSLLLEHKDEIILQEIRGVINSEYKIFSILTQLLNIEKQYYFPDDVEKFAIDYTGPIIFNDHYMEVNMNGEKYEYDGLPYSEEYKQYYTPTFNKLGFKAFNINNDSIYLDINVDISINDMKPVLILNNDLRFNYSKPIGIIHALVIKFNKDINITYDCNNISDQGHLFNENGYLEIITNSKEDVKLTIELINSNDISLFDNNRSIHVNNIYSAKIKEDDGIEQNINSDYSVNSNTKKLEITIRKN